MKIRALIGLLLLPAILGAEEAPLKIYTINPWVDVVLKDDYGIMLVNDGDERHPDPRYILGTRASRTLVDTKDIRVFQAALAVIPKSARLIPYDSCTISRSHGLTQAHHNLFGQTIKKSGLVVDEKNRKIVCYCESLEK